MTAPTVVVVIPTLGRDDRLRRTIDSVLAQDYAGDVRIMLVFDGPPDSDADRWDLQQPGRAVTHHVLTKRIGPGPARNHGVAVTSEELVAFCDDDDIWRPTKLRRQVEALDQTDAVACFCGIAVHHGGRVVERTPTEPELSYRHILQTRTAAAHQSALLTTRVAWDETGGFDEAVPGSYGEDFDWLIRIARLGHITAVAETLVDVDWHPGSHFARRWDLMDQALDYLMDKHPDLQADPRARSRIRGQQAFACAASRRRGRAVRLCWDAWRTRPAEPRTYLALLVTIVPSAANVILAALQRLGRGI